MYLLRNRCRVTGFCPVSKSMSPDAAPERFAEAGHPLSVFSSSCQCHVYRRHPPSNCINDKFFQFFDVCSQLGCTAFAGSPAYPTLAPLQPGKEPHAKLSPLFPFVKTAQLIFTRFLSSSHARWVPHLPTSHLRSRPAPAKRSNFLIWTFF